jgi:hypothetical protein
MDSNLLRHNILKTLVPQHFLALQKEGTPIGVSSDMICNKAKCSKEEYRMSIMELIDNKEVSPHNAYNVKGIYCTNKGLSAFTDKKYLKLYRKTIRDSIKDCVQIVIPILSLIIAILTITVKISDNNNKTNKIIQQMNKRIESLELLPNKSGIHPKKTGNDFLNK